MILISLQKNEMLDFHFKAICDARKIKLWSISKTQGENHRTYYFKFNLLFSRVKYYLLHLRLKGEYAIKNALFKFKWLSNESY